MKLKMLAFAVAFAVSCSAAYAQFTLSGEFRPKAQVLDGYRQLLNSSQKPAGIVAQRSRLLFDYSSAKTEYGFSIQDVRLWGQDNLTDNNTNIGVFEAWMKYKFNVKMALKAGRQKLNYDDGRILSENNWRDWGSTHDIAVFQYNNPDKLRKLDVGFAINNPGDFKANSLLDYTLKSYKYMSFFWFNQKMMSQKLDLSFTGIMDVNQKPSHVNNYNSRFTFGPNATYKNGKFSFNGIFYYQGGKLAEGTTLKANFYSVKISYKITDNLELTAAYDHYSGTDFSDTTLSKTESKAFDKLFGTSHTFLGYMDYFPLEKGKPGFGSGINDIYFRAKYSFRNIHSLEATAHLFSLDKEYMLLKSSPKMEVSKVNKNLGTELDLIYICKLSSEVEVNTGYCVMLPSETLEKVYGLNKGDSKFSHYLYFMVTFKPQFFKWQQTQKE